jgi:hypothetical protein
MLLSMFIFAPILRFVYSAILADMIVSVFCMLYFGLIISFMNTIIFALYKEHKQNMRIQLSMARRQVPFQGIT